MLSFRRSSFSRGTASYKFTLPPSGFDRQPSLPRSLGECTQDLLALRTPGPGENLDRACQIGGQMLFVARHSNSEPGDVLGWLMTSDLRRLNDALRRCPGTHDIQRAGRELRGFSCWTPAEKKRVMEFLLPAFLSLSDPSALPLTASAV
jgi:hypothetical protein